MNTGDTRRDIRCVLKLRLITIYLYLKPINTKYINWRRMDKKLVSETSLLVIRVHILSVLEYEQLNKSVRGLVDF